MFGLVILIIAFIGIIILSLFTLLKNPKSDTNRLFFLFSIINAFYLVINYQINLQTTDEGALFWVRLVMTIALFIVLLFYLLTLTFPGQKLEYKRWIVWVPIILTLLIVPLSLLDYIWLSVKAFGLGAVPGPALPIFVLYCLIFLGSGFISLIKKLRKAVGKEKAQLKFLLFGSVIMFVSILTTNLFFVIIFNNYSLIDLLPLYILAFVAFISYSIVRHKFLDISLLVARTVSYTLIVFVVVVGYISLIYGLTLLIPELAVGVKQVAVFSAISIVLFFTAGPIQRTVENITDKIFFKGRYDSEELLTSLTHIMAAELDIRLLSTRLLTKLNQEMRIVNSAFIVVDKEKKQVRIEQDHGARHFELTNEELEKLAELGNILVFEELPEGIQKMLLRKYNVSIFAPLKTKESLVGYLLLGPKASGDIYSGQDIEVLEIFGGQVAVALQNSLSYLEIQEFSRTLEKKVVERTEELKESQERELAKAKELLKLKDEFVFIATHDLRTPVTAIDGYISLIDEEKPKFSEHIEKNFAAVKEASDRLKRLINDLLEVARGESGTIKVDVASLDITQVVDRVMREVKPIAEEKKVNLESNVDPSGKTVLADEDKLYEIIENLMSNAIKFNKPDGKVTLTTKKQNNMLEIVVADTGHGIPKAEQAKVFQKFFKYRGDATVDVPGTGLGLFVVRMLIEKMGGKIGFTSEEEKGTTFTFTLPLAS